MIGGGVVMRSCPVCKTVLTKRTWDEVVECPTCRWTWAKE